MLAGVPCWQLCVETRGTDCFTITEPSSTNHWDALQPMLGIEQRHALVQQLKGHCLTGV
jgi:hypothetical protein